VKNFIAAIAGIIAFLDVMPYVVDVIRGKTKPHIVSWFTWTLLLIIATSAAFAAHQTRSALLTLGDTFGTLLVLVLGIKYGIAKFNWFDGLCQLGAILGLILWFLFDSPEIAIIASICVDFIASIPTIRHSWQSPNEETWQAFGLTVIASTLTILSLSVFRVTSLAFPIYLLLVNLAVVVVVIYRRHKLGIKFSRNGIRDSIR
jgi:hypothetical protein